MGNIFGIIILDNRPLLNMALSDDALFDRLVGYTLIETDRVFVTVQEAVYTFDFKRFEKQSEITHEEMMNKTDKINLITLNGTSSWVDMQLYNLLQENISKLDDVNTTVDTNNPKKRRRKH